MGPGRPDASLRRNSYICVAPFFLLWIRTGSVRKTCTVVAKKKLEKTDLTGNFLIVADFRINHSQGGTGIGKDLGSHSSLDESTLD